MSKKMMVISMGLLKGGEEDYLGVRGGI